MRQRNELAIWIVWRPIRFHRAAAAAVFNLQAINASLKEISRNHFARVIASLLQPC
jgi:hypothetical protein